MKKFLSLLLVAVLLVPALALSAFAAGAGDEITVEFATTANPGFAAYNAVIEYDTTALKLVKIEAGELCKAGLFSPNAAVAKVGYANTADVTGNGTLFIATFEVLEGAAAGEYGVKANFTKLANASAASVDATTFGVKDAKIVVDCTHAWGEWTEVTAATCKAEGKEARECSLCHEKESRAIAKADHKEEVIKGKDATCTEAGLTDGVKCSVCGDTLKAQEVIPALGHNWEGDTCTLCGAKEEKNDTSDDGRDDVPPTGDVTPIFAVIALALIAGTAVVLKKKAD